MGAVRGDHHTIVSWVAKVVELACANIQAIVGSNQVGCLAFGVNVEGAGVGTVHPPHDEFGPNISLFKPPLS